jgi:hypothetical protein
MKKSERTSNHKYSNGDQILQINHHNKVDSFLCVRSIKNVQQLIESEMDIECTLVQFFLFYANFSSSDFSFIIF